METGTGEEDDSAFLPRGTVQTPSFHDGLASLLSRGDERQTWKDGGTHSVMLLLMVKIHWTRLVNTVIVVEVSDTEINANSITCVRQEKKKRANLGEPGL